MASNSDQRRFQISTVLERTFFYGIGTDNVQDELYEVCGYTIPTYCNCLKVRLDENPKKAMPFLSSNTYDVNLKA